MLNKNNDLEDIRDAFREDPVILSLLEKYGLPEVGIELDIFNALIRSIIGQQLSVKSARAIYLKFLALFEDDPNPVNLLEMEFDYLRNAGLSNQKANYVQNVARFFHEKKMMNFDWESLTDQEIIDLLTGIKGVGVWTTQMLLMFALNRNDVFPIGDLGIREGMKAIYKSNKEGKELRTELIKIADQWKPYRSIASKLIWQEKDNV